MSREFPADNIEKGRWGSEMVCIFYILHLRDYFSEELMILISVSVILKMLVEISLNFFIFVIFFLHFNI